MEPHESENASISVEGNTLTITVDLSETIGPSSSGKTVIIGTTHGNQRIKAQVPGGFVWVSVNVYRYPDREQQ
jgi:hypothetical protein